MVLVGRLKIPYQDLFILSNTELECVVYGHEIDIKDSWELTRNSTGLIVSPWANKGFDIRKTMPFAWDVQDEIVFASKQDFDQARKMLDIVEKARKERNGK